MSLRTRLRDALDRVIPRAEAVDADTAREQLAACIRDTVLPGLTQARDRLAAEGLVVDLTHDTETAELTVTASDGHGCRYTVTGRTYHAASFAFPLLHGRDDRPRIVKLRIQSGERSREFRCTRCTADWIRDDCLAQIRTWLNW